MKVEKLAHAISNLAHPLLTFPIFIVYQLFTHETLPKALWLSALIVLALFVPIAVSLYLGTKKGKYTNFDVSDREQRKGFFPLVLILFVLLILVLYITHQPAYIIQPFVFAFTLMSICYAANFFSKVSLHTSLTLFLSCLIFSLNPIFGIFMFIFTCLMAWSRWYLKRHSIAEILGGAVIGSCVGLAYIMFG